MQKEIPIVCADGVHKILIDAPTYAQCREIVLIVEHCDHGAQQRAEHARARIEINTRHLRERGCRIGWR